MNDNIVRIFVLSGFLLQALALLPAIGRHHDTDSMSFRHVTQILAVIAFGVALVLHLIGTL